MSLVTEHPEYTAAREAEEEARFADMLRHATNLMEALPSRALAHAVVGDAHRHLGMDESAISCYQQAEACLQEKEEQAPEIGASTVTGIRTGQIVKGDPEYEAIIYSTIRAIERGEAIETALVGKGLIFRNRGDKDAAIGFFRKAADDMPGRTRPWSLLAEMYADRGETGKVVEAYENLVNVLEEDPASWRVLAVAYYEDRRPRDAVRAIKESLRLGDNTQENHALLGLALAKMALEDRERIGTTEQLHFSFVRAVVLQTAIRAYREALRLDPCSEQVRTALDKALRLVGNGQGFQRSAQR